MKLEDLFSTAIASIDVEKLEAVLTQKPEFRKDLEKNIAEMMGVVGSKLNIHSHADNISRLTASVVNAEINAGAQRHLQELAVSITSKPPETIKLSEIVALVKADGYSSDGECTLIISDETFKEISIHADADKRDYECTVRIGCHRPDADGACRTFIYSYKKPVFNTFGELDKIMFWLQQCGTRLIIDADDCETDYDTDYS